MTQSLEVKPDGAVKAKVTRVVEGQRHFSAGLAELGGFVSGIFCKVGVFFRMLAGVLSGGGRASDEAGQSTGSDEGDQGAESDESGKFGDS